MRCHTRPQILGRPLQFLLESNSRYRRVWSSKLEYCKSFTCSAQIGQQRVPAWSAATSCLPVPAGLLHPDRTVVQIVGVPAGILSLSRSRFRLRARGFKSVSSAVQFAYPDAVRMRHTSEMAGEQRVSAVEPANGELAGEQRVSAVEPANGELAGEQRVSALEPANGELPKQGTGKRFAVLMTGHAPEGAIKKYGGYGEMFVHLLSDPGETWDIFAVIEGKFPSDEELESYDGFVVSGSRHDAHGSEPWIEKLCEILRQAHVKKKKTLGVCFGHQLLSRALGGTTGRSSVGWEIGLKQITVSEALRAKPYGLGLPRVLRILEIHRDAVSEVPPGAEVLAWSEKTRIEMFSVGEHILGIQGHPEFTRDVEDEILEGRLALGVLKEEQVNEAKKSMDEGEADAEILQRLCKAFLKGK